MLVMVLGHVKEKVFGEQMDSELVGVWEHVLVALMDARSDKELEAGLELETVQQSAKKLVLGLVQELVQQLVTTRAQMLVQKLATVMGHA
jgi:hypothetical protein